MSLELAMPSNHLILRCTTFNLSQHQGLFRGVDSSHQVAKYWSFSFSISPSSEHSGLISFRMDWLHLLAVQGTLKILPQTTAQKSSSNCCFLTCIQVSEEAIQVVLYSHLLQNFPHFIVIHKVKGFCIVSRTEAGVFLDFPAFLIIHQMLAIQSLVPLPFLQPA